MAFTLCLSQAVGLAVMDGLVCVDHIREAFTDDPYALLTEAVLWKRSSSADWTPGVEKAVMRSYIQQSLAIVRGG